MSDEKFDRILRKLDALEADIWRARRRSFWLGWATGAIPTWIIWWLTS